MQVNTAWWIDFTYPFTPKNSVRGRQQRVGWLVRRGFTLSKSWELILDRAVKNGDTNLTQDELEMVSRFGITR